MSMTEKAKKSVVNIIELIVNAVILCLAMGRSCVDCTSAIRSQLVDCTIFGYLIVNSLLVLAIFIEEQQFHKYWRLAVYLLGAVLFLVTGALVLDYISKYENRHSFENIHGYFGNDNYNGIITGIGLLCIVMVVLYIIDIVLVFKNQK